MAIVSHIDAFIFSAFEGEMEYYQSHIEDISSATYGCMKYFFGTYKGKSVALTHVGLGKVQATSSFHFAYSNFKPGVAIFTGTAGAVDLDLRTGSIVIGRCQ